MSFFSTFFQNGGLRNKVFPLAAAGVQNPDLLNYFLVFKLKNLRKKRKKNPVKNLSHKFKW